MYQKPSPKVNQVSLPWACVGLQKAEKMRRASRLAAGMTMMWRMCCRSAILWMLVGDGRCGPVLLKQVLPALELWVKQHHDPGRSLWAAPY